jgi:hypothetical protein
MVAASASARAFDEFIAHDTIDTQSWTPAHRLIINTLGTRNPKIVSGGSTAS